MKWICRLIGHECLTVQTKEIISFVAPGHWCWPGVISYCPRCGLIYRSVDHDKIVAPRVVTNRSTDAQEETAQT